MRLRAIVNDGNARSDGFPHCRQDTGAGPGIQVYTDGCYEPESRTGGWAFVVYRDNLEIASDFGRVDRSSNNALELMALLKAATWLNGNATAEPSIIWSDSVYAVNGCNQWRHIWKSRGWRKKRPDPKARSRAIADQALWMAIDETLMKNVQVEIIWCKGHAGNPGNEKADRLAELGRCRADWLSELWTGIDSH